MDKDNSFFINHGKEMKFNDFCIEKNLSIEDVEMLLTMISKKEEVTFDVSKKYLEDAKKLSAKPHAAILEKALDVFYGSNDDKARIEAVMLMYDLAFRT